MIRTIAEPLSPAPASTSDWIKPLVSIVMLIATILTMLFELPAFVTIFQGPVTYQGVTLTTHDGKGVVAAVSDPKLIAQGVRPGQPLAWEGRSAWRAAWPQAGDSIQIQTPQKTVSVFAAHSPFAPSLQVIATAMVLGSLGVLIFAGVLAYRRPGVMTVAFWLFVAANFNISWLMNAYGQAPEAVGRPIVLFIEAVLGGWSYFPVVWFALRFPDDRIIRRDMRVADYCWTIVSAAALLYFAVDLAGITFGNSGTGDTFENQFWRYTIPQNVPSVVALGAFLWVYARAGAVVRQRAMWGIVGLVLMIVFEIIGNFMTESTTATYFIGNIVFLLATFCPLALIYAVLRHHLLDISFVVNRALVYSALTALIVLVIGFADWIVGKYLFETRAALAVDAAVAVGMGFVLQRTHGVLERAVDRMIFASRHAAERHIDRVIAGLAFAQNQGTILRALVDDPSAALDLVSSSIFMDDGAALVLRAHDGWQSHATAALDRDDPIARLMLAERDVVDVTQAHWRSDIKGIAPGSLDIAVPLLSRNHLLGIALYGRHRNGSAIDPEERRLLHKLCESAAVAYEAVELARTREALAAVTSGLDHTHG